MTGLIKRFERNTVGRDLAVGDIHGNFTGLQAALDAAEFNPDIDRLFSVGDLVDRGDECRDALVWLDKPWFNSVRGNHDDYICRYDTCDWENWIRNGGGWFFDMSPDEQAKFVVRFREIPIAIELETDGGLIGIVHADCAYSTWGELRDALSSDKPKDAKSLAMWSRSRVENMDTTEVQGVRAVICGHTPMPNPAVIGNVYHIDTAGWHPKGRFTLLELRTLELA